jgi:hypothetical protein
MVQGVGGLVGALAAAALVVGAVARLVRSAGATVVEVRSNERTFNILERIIADDGDPDRRVLLMALVVRLGQRLDREAFGASDPARNSRLQRLLQALLLEPHAATGPGHHLDPVAVLEALGRLVPPEGADDEGRAQPPVEREHEPDQKGVSPLAASPPRRGRRAAAQLTQNSR